MTISFNHQTKKKAVKYASPYPLPPSTTSWPDVLVNEVLNIPMEADFNKFSTFLKTETPDQETPATKKHPLVDLPLCSYYVDLVVFTAEKGLSLRCREHHSYPSLASAEHQFTLLTSKYANWLKEGKNRRAYISYSKIFPCTPGYDATSSMIDYWDACSPKDKIYVNGPKANFKDKTSA